MRSQARNKETILFARAVFVIDRRDCIAYTEYVADQRREPEYGAAMQAIQQAAME